MPQHRGTVPLGYSWAEATPPPPDNLSFFLQVLTTISKTKTTPGDITGNIKHDSFISLFYYTTEYLYQESRLIIDHLVRASKVLISPSSLSLSLSVCVSPLYLLPSSWLLLSRGTRAVSARTSLSLWLIFITSQHQAPPGTASPNTPGHTRPHQGTNNSHTVNTVTLIRTIQGGWGLSAGGIYRGILGKSFFQIFVESHHPNPAKHSFVGNTRFSRLGSKYHRSWQNFLLETLRFGHWTAMDVLKLHTGFVSEVEEPWGFSQNI